MKFENTEVWGFRHAIRGMRNPMESWDKSDSFESCSFFSDYKQLASGDCLKESGFDKNGNLFIIGHNDMELMKKLIKAGPEHRKFLRQIFVSVDITAPLYWWKEFDTYKVGTVANSCSTMHKLKDTPITMECFEMGDFEDMKTTTGIDISLYWKDIINVLEDLRCQYSKTKDKRYWKELIRLLPESWLQKRTITMNYENVANMYKQRMKHKLTEWSTSFIQWADSLPYFKELFTV